MSKSQPRLALLAGGGTLPAVLISGAQAKGFEVHLITFTGQPQPELDDVKVASEAQYPLGAIGKIHARLKAQRITHVALAGHLHRPSLFTLKMDTLALKLLTRLRGFSDDALLKLLTGYMVEVGFQVLAVSDLAPQLLAPTGVLGRLKPTSAERKDIDLARDALNALGPHDVGQAAIIYRGTILGLEGVEGTDALIERCAVLRGTMSKNERAGVLVKLAKPGQTSLADLPTVGPHTLKLLARHGYRGLAIEGGQTILLGGQTFIPQADKSNLFLLGL